MPNEMTYAKAGVDIDKKSDSIAALVEHLAFRRKGLGAPLEIGEHFTGLIDFGDMALTLCTDGVGTKLIVANEMRKWDTIGIDCIAMNVNDTICVGAEPVAFVDYIAIDRPNSEITSQVGEGLETGARKANVTIVGGEVAVLPEIVNGFDLAGTCLGAVKKERIVSGEDIRPGDSLIGLASTGIHSNGLTLARKIIEANELAMKDKVGGLPREIGIELLEPTEIYVRQVLELLGDFRITGMANITGGGLRNLLRLKKGIGFEIDEPMPPSPIFDVLQDLGGVLDKEMYQTFNMGMGFSIVAPEDDASGIVGRLGNGAKVIGHSIEGGQVTVPSKDIEFDRY